MLYPTYTFYRVAYPTSPANTLRRNPSRSAADRLPVNTGEDASRYWIELAAPGRTKESFSLGVEEGLLRIRVQAPASQEAGYTRREFVQEASERSFRLPPRADSAQIRASYEAGILRVELPKRQPQQVEIQ
jgi:HSP20 family protein